MNVDGASRYPQSFRPIELGGVEIPHRLFITGHTQLYGEGGFLSQRHVDYYRERAKGGAALLILEQQAAHPSGRNYLRGCVAYDEGAIPMYEALGEAVHAHGAKQFVQLFGCGAQGSGTQYIDDWRPLWAASRLPSAFTGEIPVAMEADHIEELVKSFAKSARNVQRAGLDGVEIHAAHSQLLGEFLSPAFNKRSDGYGGSLRNRCRIVLETGEAIRKEVGSGFPLGIRLSFDEYLGDAGITAEQCEEQIEIFSASGLFDFFDISGGGYHALHIAVAPMGTNLPEGFLADSAKRVKAVAGDRAKVMVVGRVLDLETAERILADDAADMVALTRANMADAHVIAKSAAGNERDVVRCIGANVCIARLIENREVTCFQNPSMGREAELGKGTLRKASPRKKLVVAGGGPAGMRFAGVAAARGHDVTLFEASDHLGGRLAELSRLPTRGAWQRAIENLHRPLEREGVRIVLDKRLHADSDELADADEVICATGSRWDATGYSPYRPERASIPGYDLGFVIDAGTAVERATASAGALGRRVLIVDETGEYLPVGLAELLVGQGCDVEILTPRPQVGADTQRTLDMPHVFPRLAQAGVEMTALHFVERFEANCAEVYNVWGGPSQRREGLDTVVLAMTRTPEADFFAEISKRGRSALRVGDVVAPRKIEAIVYEAERLGRSV
ncbi:MAG: FAD-dependent oxidoreductase [Myxococcales bacterium]|nr:FAD-dependent oxidoreductase [Myxococcales bacterium]